MKIIHFLTKDTFTKWLQETYRFFRVAKFAGQFPDPKKFDGTKLRVALPNASIITKPGSGKVREPQASGNIVEFTKVAYTIGGQFEGYLWME